MLSTGLADPVILVPRPSAAELAGGPAPLLLELTITSVGAAALACHSPRLDARPARPAARAPRPGAGPAARRRPRWRAAAGGGRPAGAAAPSASPGQEGLALPGGLILRASGHPGQLSLRTEPPFAVPGIAGGPPGELMLELDLALAKTSGAPDVTATVSLGVPLGGTWGAVSAALSYAHGTVSLAIMPTSAAGTALAPSSCCLGSAAWARWPLTPPRPCCPRCSTRWRPGSPSPSRRSPPRSWRSRTRSASTAGRATRPSPPTPTRSGSWPGRTGSRPWPPPACPRPSLSCGRPPGCRER